MLNALRALGVTVRHSEDGAYSELHGLGGAFPGGEATLFLGNSGTHDALPVRRNLRRQGTLTR